MITTESEQYLGLTKESLCGDHCIESEPTRRNQAQVKRQQGTQSGSSAFRKVDVQRTKCVVLDRLVNYLVLRSKVDDHLL